MSVTMIESVVVMVDSYGELTKTHWIDIGDTLVQLHYATTKSVTFSGIWHGEVSLEWKTAPYATATFFSRTEKKETLKSLIIEFDGEVRIDSYFIKVSGYAGHSKLKDLLDKDFLPALKAIR